MFGDPEPLPADGSAPPSQPDPPPPSRQVLIVEDDVEIQRALSALLAEEGYGVAVASHGAAALAALRDAPKPDLILLDLMMPVLDGWGFRIEQKKNAALAEIPVVVLSANDSPQARAMDAAAYLRKPIGGSTLLSTVEQVITSAQRDRAERADRLAVLGGLAAGVVHEIANPLTVISASLEAVRADLAGVAPEHTLRSLDDAITAAARIAGVVREVRTFSRQQRSESTSSADVRVVVRAAVALVVHELRQRADIATRLEQTPPVAIHPQRLEQVIVNLLLNAANAIEDGHADENGISVNTFTAADGRAVIEVADTGGGMTRDRRARVFDPFETVRQSSVSGGMGLAVAHAIVRRAGGEIECDTAPGAGSVFRVLLPPAPAAMRADDAPRPAVSAPAERLRILVVDDEPGIVRIMTRILERRHAVVGTTSPLDALTLAREQSFDLLLCDLTMPDVSGAELLRLLEEVDPQLAASAIIMTGGAFTPGAAEFLERSTHPVLAKPFTGRDVDAALATRLLQRRAQP